MFFCYERLTGVLDMVVVKAAVEAAGRLVPVKAVFQITRVATGSEAKKEVNIAVLSNARKKRMKKKVLPSIAPHCLHLAFQPSDRQ